MDVVRISSRHQHPKITQSPTIKKVGVFSNFLPMMDFRSRDESAKDHLVDVIMRGSSTYPKPENITKLAGTQEPVKTYKRKGREEEEEEPNTRVMTLYTTYLNSRKTKKLETRKPRK